jgi:hypothetical protein
LIELFFPFVATSISFAVAETKLFRQFREYVEGKNSLWGKFVSCGYCLGYWIALVLVFIYRVKLFSAWSPLDYFFTALVIAWLSGFQWVLMCWLMEKAGK